MLHVHFCCGYGSVAIFSLSTTEHDKYNIVECADFLCVYLHLYITLLAIIDLYFCYKITLIILIFIFISFQALSLNSYWILTVSSCNNLIAAFITNLTSKNELYFLATCLH